MLPPALYLLPVTLSDRSPADVLPDRNLRVLGMIKHFVVENVRTARRFLKKVDPGTDIDALSFTELSEHTPAADVDAMLAPLLKGHPVGVMSEAGCPAVADPGAMLVAAAQRRGLPVVPLVGPSSILLALMASGMDGQRFAFDGYLPVDDRARDHALRDIAADVTRTGRTHIFIETPYRNNRLIARMTRLLPPGTMLCVASDITGAAQSIVTLPLAGWEKRQYDYHKIPTIFLLGRMQ